MFRLLVFDGDDGGSFRWEVCDDRFKDHNTTSIGNAHMALHAHTGTRSWEKWLTLKGAVANLH